MNYGTIDERLREGLYSGGGYDLQVDAAAATGLDKYPPRGAEVRVGGGV